MNTLMAAVVSLALAAPMHFPLNAPENVWDVMAEDFDQNGVRDVLLLCSDETAKPLKKSIGVYLGDETGAYRAKPDLSIPLGASTGAYFLAEVDGAAPREVVAANADGATVYRFLPDAQVFEITHEPRFVSLLPSNTREPKFLRTVAEDLDEDGVDEWLVPVPSGYRVRNAVKELAAVGCDVNSEIYRASNLHIRHRLPNFLSFTAPGQERNGLAFLSDEFADFAHGDNWGERWRFDIPLNLEDKWDAGTSMSDVNNDGFPDLVVTQTRGTVNLESISQIYVAEAPFKYPDKPTAHLHTKGAMDAPMLKDVDGDGDEDVVVISIPFGVKNIINFFVRGKVSITAQVYEYDGTDFGDKPAFKTNLTLDAPEGREQISYAMDEFSGDGRLDLAYSKNKDELVIFHGEADEFVSSKPAHTIKMPSFGVATTHDLKNDGSKDIIVHHPAGKDDAKRVEVVVF